MKTAKEILWDNLVFMGENNPEWKLDDVLRAMKEYAEQTIDICVEDAQVEIVDYFENYNEKSGRVAMTPQYGVNSESILNVKKLLK